MMPMLTYTEARSQIATGDIVGVKTRTPGGAITRTVQRLGGLPHYHVTHIALAYWLGGRLFAVEESVGGNRFVPMSQYAPSGLVVCDRIPGTDIERLPAAIDRATESHVPYSYLDLVAIGIRVLLGRWFNTQRLGNDGGAELVCSVFAPRVAGAAGADLSAMPNMPCPAEVVRALSVKFEVGA